MLILMYTPKGYGKINYLHHWNALRELGKEKYWLGGFIVMRGCDEGFIVVRGWGGGRPSWYE